MKNNKLSMLLEEKSNPKEKLIQEIIPIVGTGILIK
jgi:hypothetical protein